MVASHLTVNPLIDVHGEHVILATCVLSQLQQADLPTIDPMQHEMHLDYLEWQLAVLIVEVWKVHVARLLPEEVSPKPALRRCFY